MAEEEQQATLIQVETNLIEESKDNHHNNKPRMWHPVRDLSSPTEDQFTVDLLRLLMLFDP